MDYRFRKVCIFAFACSSIGAMAQVDRSGLDGTVEDTSGKFLPGASITLVQTATGLRRETVTSTKGSYDIPELPIGVYRITFNAPCFQEKTVEGILNANRKDLCRWLACHDDHALP